MVSSDLGSTWDDFGLAQPSPTRSRSKPPGPLGPKMQVDAPPPRVWDCCAVAAMSDETHLVPPLVSQSTLAGWHPSDGQHSRLACVAGGEWEGGARVWGA